MARAQHRARDQIRVRSVGQNCPKPILAGPDTTSRPSKFFSDRRGHLAAQDLIWLPNSVGCEDAPCGQIQVPKFPPGCGQTTYHVLTGCRPDGAAFSLTSFGHASFKYTLLLRDSSSLLRRKSQCRALPCSRSTGTRGCEPVRRTMKVNVHVDSSCHEPFNNRGKKSGFRRS